MAELADPFTFADTLGPERVLHIHEPALDLRAVLVVDNTAIGPSIGGVRMAVDVNAREAFRLARAMTLKNAAAGLPHGGGKAVILGNSAMPVDRKEAMIRAFARAIAPLVDYIPGPDMGTDEACMAWVRNEIGRSVGLPRELGGIPLDEIGATGFGLAAAAEVAEGFAGVSLAGARVAVQGFGAVGYHAARCLVAKGAMVVAAADRSATLVDPAGLDVAALRDLKTSGGRLADFPKGQKLPSGAIVEVDCDIWIPAARPDVLDAGNVDRLRAKLVLEGANIPITPEAEIRLHSRGVLVVPDFIANAGGVICAAVEYRGGDESMAMAIIDERISANTRAVLEEAARTEAPPRQAAVALAERRVRTAMQFRRWR
jgi:glutamate dehydrogenase (NAD(P)+)